MLNKDADYFVHNTSGFLCPVVVADSTAFATLRTVGNISLDQRSSTRGRENV